MIHRIVEYPRDLHCEEVLQPPQQRKALPTPGKEDIDGIEVFIEEKMASFKRKLINTLCRELKKEMTQSGLLTAPQSMLDYIEKDRK